jgi:flagellar hook-length control protein FliK
MESSLSGKLPSPGSTGGTGTAGSASGGTATEAADDGGAVSPFQRLIAAADEAKGDGDAPDAALLARLAALVQDAEDTNSPAADADGEGDTAATGAVAALAALLDGEQATAAEAQKAELPALRLVALKLAGAASEGANGQPAQSANGARLAAGLMQHGGDTGASRTAAVDGTLANGSLSTTTAGSNLSSQPPVGAAAQAPIAPARPGFDGAMAQQVRWMAERGLEQAEIRLEPPNLGRIGVRLRLEGDQAMLSFHSAHAPVREAVESAVPRLRELLADAGIELAGVEVGSDEGARQGSAWDEAFGDGESAGGPAAGDPDGTAAAAGSSEIQTGTGLFDAYA